jgi:hypothetical protein
MTHVSYLVRIFRVLSTHLSSSSLQLIPPYLTGSTAQATLDILEPQLTAAQREVNTLSADNAFLRNEVKELQKRLREGNSVGGRLGKRVKTEEESNSQSQGGNASQSGSQAMRGGSASLSPQKKGRPGSEFISTSPSFESNNDSD